MNLEFYPCGTCKEYKKDKKKFVIKRNWWQTLLGYCPWCCRYFKYNIKCVRRNSQYNDPRNNWITACKQCREEDDEYFKDLWQQYYSDCF